MKTTFDVEKKQAQIELLAKDNKIKEQRLQSSGLLRNVMAGGFIVLTLFGLIGFRYTMLKRRHEKLRLEKEIALQEKENEKRQSDWQHKTVELEMKVLRAQMNPHFIFNSLNSINRFILQNERTQASGYLTKFSKLVRLILQNSQAELISLESELEALELYLDLEALRFDDHFNYKIEISTDLDISGLKVPPLIIQPFVENAIWHGLMNKEEKGQLDIGLSLEKDYLYCRITDNGIGRKKAAEIAGKTTTRNKSMGLHITEDRITLIQREESFGTPVKINDLTLPDGSPAGTEVLIRLPVIYA